MKRVLAAVPRYNTAFWNLQRGHTYDAADLSIVNTDGAGAHYLPGESNARFRAEQEKLNVFRKISTVVFTESDDRKIKTVLPTGAAAFVSEGETIPDSNADVAQHMIRTHRIAKIAKVSNELVADAGFDLEGAIAADLGREFGKVEEEACITGGGAGCPYGVLHPTEGAEPGVTATGALGFDEVKALHFVLGAEYRRNAVWLMSDETALHLRTLKDDAGRYLWRDTDDTIFGRPVYTSPYMPGATSGKSPILFGDFSFYWLMERGGIALKALREKYAAQDVTGFIGTEFIDGRLVRREAIKALTMA